MSAILQNKYKQAALNALTEKESPFKPSKT